MRDFVNSKCILHLKSCVEYPKKDIFETKHYQILNVARSRCIHANLPKIFSAFHHST